jgi:hypothetical protein
MLKSPQLCTSQWKVDFLVIYIQIEGITFFLDVSVHLYVDNHELPSWHRRFLECCRRMSTAHGKAGFSNVKRNNIFY